MYVLCTCPIQAFTILGLIYFLIKLYYYLKMTAEFGTMLFKNVKKKIMIY